VASGLGRCVIEVCSSLIIFISLDKVQVLIARLPQAKRWQQAVGREDD